MNIRNRRHHVRAQSHHSFGIESLEARQLLAGDLVAEWNADLLDIEDGGVIQSWPDSGGERAAIRNGTPTLAAGAVGGRNAVAFEPSDGSDSFDVSAANSPISLADDFSLAVVFQTQSDSLTGSNADWFLNTGIVDANQLGLGRDWGLTINSAGQLSTGMTGGFGQTPQSVYSNESGLNDGNPHIAIVTRSGGSLSIYVDGNEAATITDADTQARSSEKLRFGDVLAGDSKPFDGLIANIRAYDGALSAAEVSTVHDELFAYYNNSAPVAVDDVYTTAEDTLLFLIPANQGVLANDFDAEGDPLTIELIEGTSRGTLNLAADGGFVYDSDTNFSGTDTFTYRVSNFQTSEIATVTINVTPMYDPVRPVEDNYRARPGQTINIPGLVGVLANDDNPDQADMTAVLVDDVSDGSLTFNADGSFRFEPQGFAGTTSFTYQVHDGTGLSSVSRVTLAITSPPIGNADILQATEDTLLTLTGAAGIFANDVDAEGDPLSARLVQDVENGTMALSPNGQLIYTPNPDFNGTDTFSYILSDGYDDVGPIDVQINVAAVNDAPKSAPDAYYTLPGTPLVRSVEQGLLANDVDVEDGEMSASLLQPIENGTLVLSQNGAFTFTPDDGFVGRTSFMYTATDEQGAASTAEVTIEVAEQPFIISEFMAVNSETIDTRTRLDPADRFRGTRISPDWIEVQNRLDLDFDIGGLHLTDDPEDLTKWAFPTGTLLPAGGRIVVFASGLDVNNTELDNEEMYHTNFKLSSTGEFLAVTSDDGTILHSYETYPRQFGDLSYGVADDTIGYLLTPTLGEANVTEVRNGLVDSPTIETEHGFFTEPIQVTISNADETATLRYTLDGSTPSEDNGEVYTGPITVNKTTVVRAAATKEGMLPSRVDTRSYVFLDDVLTQSLDGEPQEGWPERWGSNRTDYGMDPDIVNDPEWGPQMMDALTQIPSMSIVTDLDNLFDSRNGIYARPSADGEAAERPASIELLNPDGSVGFQHNIGLRIRGGFSRSTNNPKHAFRLFFDSLHGEGRLNYPLFAEDGADSFAKVDLRTTQNYSWAFQGDGRNAFLRDVFSRDLQRQMGSPSTRGEFYHLYINGMYFGMFQTDERPEANFGASYMGGNPDDYDVIHNDPRANGATNGNTDAYRRLWEKIQQEGGLSDANMEDYYATQGMNMDGSRNPEFERLLDVDNLIDYMIITYYTSDADGPGSKFTRPGLNNYFAIYNREDPDGFKFVEHDSEHSLDTGNAAGANYNMVTPFVNNGRTFGNFNPHYMHEQLAQTNSDYLQRFIDRVNEVFQDDGLLGDENVIKILRDRAAEFDMAIIAESARWGDAQRATRPYTKDNWETAVNNIVRWVTSRDRGAGRRSEVLGQLRGVDWYPSEEHVAPTFSQNGGRVDAGFPLVITAPPAGTLYYTSDGTDPRASGGAVSGTAIQIASGAAVPINSGGFVKARVLTDGVWSPITSEQFFVEPLASVEQLRISEVHYNPAQPSVAAREAGFTDKDDFEFIEVINVSDTTIDLSSAQFTQTTIDGNDEGVVFNFADGDIAKLAPGERAVVVENIEAFRFRYGNNIAIAGQWTGGLSNSGETLTLAGEGDTVLQFKYSDMWHESTDGNGFSLEIKQPDNADLTSWNIADSWSPSASVGGSPGSGSVLPGDSNGDGVFDSSDLVLVFQSAEYEDDIEDNSTFAEGDWDGDGDFTSSDIILAFQTGRYEQPRAVRRDTETKSPTAETTNKRRLMLDFAARDLIFADASVDSSLSSEMDDTEDEDRAFAQ